MGIIQKANKRIKRLDLWDIGSIKWGAIFFGIIIGAYIADFTKKYIWVHITLAVLLLIRPVYRFCKQR